MVGVNCHFDMFVALETMKKMKAGLQAAGLNPYLMMQPVIMMKTMMMTMVMMIMMTIADIMIIFADCLPVSGRREARYH